MIKSSDINEEDFNDRYKLLMDRFVARRLKTDPEMIERAKDYLRQVRAKGRPEWYWWIDEWMEILDQPVEKIRRDITKTTEKWKQMRLVSPLGMVSGLDFFQDLQWRRRMIRKARVGLVLVRNSQYERMVSGPYQGDDDDPRSKELDWNEVLRRYDMLSHRIIARALVDDPGIVKRYRKRLTEMLSENRPDDTWWIKKWISILDQPIGEIRKEITSRNEEWDELRRVSFMSNYIRPELDRHQLNRIFKKARKGLMLKTRKQQEMDGGYDGISNSR